MDWMGIDFADYDNDGRADLFVNALSLQGYVLFRNTGKGFDDRSDSTGITNATWNSSGWGAKFVDFDNDGWKDLMIGQGHVMDTISIDFPQLSYREKMKMLRNVHGRFEDVSRQSGAPFRIPLAARGAAFGDIDNNGCVGAVVSVNDGAPLLLRNGCTGLGRHWLTLRLEGTASNRDGIGARVRVTTTDGSNQYAFVSTSSSYLSASDVRPHFGLGTASLVRQVRIEWPNGAVQKLEKREDGPDPQREGAGAVRPARAISSALAISLSSGASRRAVSSAFTAAATSPVASRARPR
jgi:hypothetical protein